VRGFQWIGSEATSLQPKGAPGNSFASFPWSGDRATVLVYMCAKLVGWTLLVCLLLLTGCEPPRSIPQGVQVYFSPHGGATAAVVNALDQATNTVLVQAYSFTSAPIARALVDAQRRGVKVQVILDKSQRTEKYSETDFLKNEGIPTLIDDQHAIAHNKIMILDGFIVLTGSFNFTKAAEENNAENLLVIVDPVLAKQYIENWHAHEGHSEAFYLEDRSETRTGRNRRE
jgi:phosphatidylserine/phosphatidylglycerophosphate/cardiolipin synthase-like enzyme